MNYNGEWAMVNSKREMADVRRENVKLWTSMIIDGG